MKTPSSIAHPLIHRTGTSQRTRTIDALHTNAAPIDGKTLADRLYVISKYAQQINYYEYIESKSGTPYQDIDNWNSFFQNSLPFQLAVLSKISISDLEVEYESLHHELKSNPSKQALESLLNFVLSRLITPTKVLYDNLEEKNNSFVTVLLAIIKSSFVDSLLTFIKMHNASTIFLCVAKKNFTNFMVAPWQLSPIDIHAVDTCMQQSKKGKEEAYHIAAERIDTIFYQVLSGFQEIIETAADFIEEALRPLEESQKKMHQPHLGLLFMFLELFNNLQGNINDLGKEHLDFFYKKVLRINAREAIPDKAHIVFEIAKHLDAYLLKEDLLLKNGKDANNQDIQFGLDQEIIIDKAQITDLRTLSLYKTESSEYIEGIYMAPVANSVDGLGKKFGKEQSVNWPTLGSKYSKFLKKQEVLDSPEDEKCGEKEEIPPYKEHPKARLGFVLSSPILLLQEGKRTITIILDCNHPFLLKDQIENKLKTSPAPIFKIWLSGEKEWIPVTPKVTIPESNQIPNYPSPQGQIQFQVEIVLDIEDPGITFFDSEKLKEKLNVKTSNPVVKIELNEEASILYGANDNTSDGCCLKKKKNGDDKIKASPYTILQELQLVDAQIDVVVCGVKNLIVQNDEGALDINSQIFPFGLRPEVPGFDPMNQVDLAPSDNNPPVDNPNSRLGPSFYIGSKEILFKKWNSVRVNIEWKEKPDSFHDHYKAYIKNVKDLDSPPKETSLGLSESEFKLKIEELENGSWSEINEIDLFSTTNPAFGNLNCGKAPATDSPSTPIKYAWEVENKDPISYINYDQPLDFFKQAKNGFLKFTLANQDFLHKEYPFVLARQMLAYAFVDQANEEESKKLADAIYISGSNKTVISPVVDLLDSSVISDLDLKVGEIVDAVKSVYTLINDTNNQNPNIVKNVENVKQDLEDARDSFETDLTTYFTNIITETINFSDTFNDDVKDPVVDTFNDIANGNAKKAVDDLSVFFNELLDRFEEVPGGLNEKVDAIDTLLTDLDEFLSNPNILSFLEGNAYQALIPNEPWTPIIKNMFVDYAATAAKADMDIIHLYPFENTSKYEDIDQGDVTLFPEINEEGTLLIGIENVTPGSTLSILFQLAEATANSEMDRAQINWYYLRNNTWVELLQDFNIISDETDGLTVSGIVTIAVPDDINKNGNTVMPDTLYWIKVATATNATAVAETIGIHTQAAKASARLTVLNDTNRLDTALENGSISKLAEGDFSIKKVEQPYPSFEGRPPEDQGYYYTRVSEHLKHKGRALMINDYEKIILEGFPQLYKVKCISHTMGLSAITYQRDLEIAPGFVVITVIPDLTKLLSGNQLEPKVPVSLLEKIGNHLRKTTTPFARIKIMNPRYEKVHVNVSVRLYRGKSTDFYRQRLKEDITNLLAPWFLGDSEKIAFGMPVLFSDVVGFVEQLDYVDFITNLQLKGERGQEGSEIKPLTARSILTAGQICVGVDEEDCTGTDSGNGTSVGVIRSNESSQIS